MLEFEVVWTTVLIHSHAQHMPSLVPRIELPRPVVPFLDRHLTGMFFPWLSRPPSPTLVLVSLPHFSGCSYRGVMWTTSSAIARLLLQSVWIPDIRAQHLS